MNRYAVTITGLAPRISKKIRDSSLISTSVRMVHPQRTSDEKRPGRGRQRISPREFATTGPRTPETAANYLLHRGLRQDGGGDQRGVSKRASGNCSGTTTPTDWLPLMRRCGFRWSIRPSAGCSAWRRPR